MTHLPTLAASHFKAMASPREAVLSCARPRFPDFPQVREANG